jgi:hypothetical protein
VKCRSVELDDRSKKVDGLSEKRADNVHTLRINLLLQMFSVMARKLRPVMNETRIAILCM